MLIEFRRSTVKIIDFATHLRCFLSLREGVVGLTKTHNGRWSGYRILTERGLRSENLGRWARRGLEYGA
jgi:hypothetical protein